MKNNRNGRSALGALALFAVFALGLLSVLLGGARAYARLTQQGQASYDGRTGIQYMATRVRQAPEGVSLAPFGDVQALVIPETVQGQRYVTRVYCHEGWLMELFSPDGDGFQPRDGEKIMPMNGLSLTLSDGLLTVSLVDTHGICWEIRLHLRGSGEVGP